jgi:trehalose 6-phosphate synthase/phosphatase
MVKITKTGIIEKYRNATDKLVLLDYDGTLVNYASNPANAEPSQDLSGILRKLSERPKTKVIIISGRSHHDLDRFLGHLSINFIAEHGALIKENGIWKEQITDNCLWKKPALQVFDQITSACPESFVEEKTFSLVWHYRNAGSQTGYDHSRELISILENISNYYKLKILDGNKAVEIMPDKIGKGIAVKKLIDLNNYDFLLSIGDDVTDEEIFELFMNDTNAVTIKVGNGRTVAKYKFDNVSDVIELLKYLSQ